MPLPPAAFSCRVAARFGASGRVQCVAVAGAAAVGATSACTIGVAAMKLRAAASLLSM
jgi:hypothetical protein